MNDVSAAELGITQQKIVEKPLTGYTERRSPPEYSISLDDTQLVDFMLHPDRGPFLYSKLLGETEAGNNKSWTEEEQQKAKAGMRELFDAEMSPVRFAREGIEGARAGLRNLQTDPKHQELYQQLRNSGRDLGYQDTGTSIDNNEVLKGSGNFLHFGVNFTYEGLPDKLDYGARIYVTPKLPLVGHVAAEVIKRARERGYEPYGKVYDQSSTTLPLHDRKDRILFYPQTASQMQIIIDCLREIHSEQPDLFEENPPILTERTDIPGVGIADEPIRVNGDKKSFTASREELITEAWAVTRNGFTPKGKVEYVVGDNGMILEKSFVDFRKAVESGAIPLDYVISTFRNAVREASHKYGVSPDNFARNMTVPKMQPV